MVVSKGGQQRASVVHKLSCDSLGLKEQQEQDTNVYTVGLLLPFCASYAILISAVFFFFINVVQPESVDSGDLRTSGRFCHG